MNRFIKVKILVIGTILSFTLCATSVSAATNTSKQDDSYKKEQTVKTSKTTKNTISYTNADIDLLARLITAEATGQPYKAMVSVGAVVVNRVQSKEWPNTISKVINHVSAGYYQFSPVKNGYIKKPASKTAIKAAKAALKGIDPTNGAMFYFDDSTNNKFLLEKKVSVKYDNMVFVY